jgi:hypothetical protein
MAGFFIDQKSSFCYNSHIESKKEHMKYTLITRNGKVLTFFLKTVAEQFQTAYGGVVITQQVLETQETAETVDQ